VGKKRKRKKTLEPASKEKRREKKPLKEDEKIDIKRREGQKARQHSGLEEKKKGKKREIKKEPHPFFNLFACQRKKGKGGTGQVS